MSNPTYIALASETRASDALVLKHRASGAKSREESAATPSGDRIFGWVRPPRVRQRYRRALSRGSNRMCDGLTSPGIGLDQQRNKPTKRINGQLACVVGDSY